MTQTLHQIIIVGGGAGGLELATRLGNKLRNKKAAVTLVDKERTHLWKPLLHEVAAGSMDSNDHELDYLAQARWHHFTFVCGAMIGLNRAEQTIFIAPALDEYGNEIIPQRTLHYDTLILSVGSVTNSYGVPGVAEHAFCLDNTEQADRFHQHLVNACLRADFYSSEQSADSQLHVVIVGGGATGVELAAELHSSLRLLTTYGLKNINPERQIRIILINADTRILSALPEHLSKATTAILEKLNVEIVCNEQVVEVLPDSIKTKSGQTIPSDLTVWAAGIKGPDWLRNLDHLETNRLNQIVVLPTMQTTLDTHIFAFGDCAACPWKETNKMVPPRAQAAHQQASHLFKTILHRLDGKPALPYQYRDFGSLISLGQYSTVGTLMGFISGGSIWLEGLFARIMYITLYKMHQHALHGLIKVVLDTLALLIKRRTEPRVKLH
jgi:NADH dehydrogenase